MRRLVDQKRPEELVKDRELVGRTDNFMFRD
jgi:hypothetical protein